MKQYVEVTKGEPVRWPRNARGHAGRSGVSAVAVEALMNNVGSPMMAGYFRFSA